MYLLSLASPSSPPTGGDKSRDLSAARISVYEAGLDVANPDLDPYDNFVAFQTRVSAQYDAMIPVCPPLLSFPCFMGTLS
jgi:hypothetical protein